MPPCEVYQSEIDAVTGPNLELSLNVTRGFNEDMTI